MTDGRRSSTAAAPTSPRCGYALDRLGARATVTTDAAVIRAAPRVLLPGVGAAEDAMLRLEQAGLAAVIPTLVQPVLGICLGMQLLFDDSTESSSGARTRCLGIVPGSVTRLEGSPETPVPHMGWNRLEPVSDDPLFEAIDATRLFLLRAQLRGAGDRRDPRFDATTGARSPLPFAGEISAACSSTRNAPPPRARACCGNFLRAT